MATEDECRQALQRLADRMAAGTVRVDLDRRLACEVTDLAVAFHGRLTGGVLTELADGDDPGAELRLVASSDDLLALTEGTLPIAGAVASGRVRLRANPFDLLKLRKLL